MSVKKIALFIDVQNIYYTTRQVFGRPFNYRDLMANLQSQGDIVAAYAYAIDRGDTQQQKFQSALTHMGIDVKLKPYIQRQDGSAKGDWDVGITIDIMELSAEVDSVVLLSGDGDFAILLDTINSKFGVETTVFSVPALTANALVKSATHYFPITETALI